MRKYIGIALFCLIAIEAYSQCPSTVYVRDLGKYGKVERCQITEEGEVINLVINFYSEQTYNYGKWKVYYPNGEPKEEGFITLDASGKSRNIDFGAESNRYTEKRVGNWIFWDQQGNQTVNLY
jgi:hypothetical protein